MDINAPEKRVKRPFWEQPYFICVEHGYGDTTVFAAVRFNGTLTMSIPGYGRAVSGIKLPINKYATTA